MKNIIIIISILLASCINQFKGKNDINTSTGKYILKNDRLLYEVYKVDSLNNYYLIYARKNDSLYKIVSNKEAALKCENRIKINSRYNFIVHSMGDNSPMIVDVKIKPMNYLDIQCYQFDEKTKICKEEGIYDLYFATNIKGLCFIKNQD